MERLNYFNPYQSKSPNHENQLTRAYLVLLKHSFHAFSVFFNYCHAKHKLAADENPISLTSLLEAGWQFDTQKGNPGINTNLLLSVLITDAQLENNNSVSASDRNARYDGIITFGSELTMILEVKPRSEYVWFGQLNPSKEGLSEETKVYTHPAQLEWKEIIRQLNHLLSIPTLAGSEKIMIEDFLSFIDQNFPYLNPFDSFHLCKGYPELIHRRIQNLLKSIVQDEQIIKYHNGWGYYIETPFYEIQKIGLVLKIDQAKNEWWLELAFYFADTQNQAKAFYSSRPSISHLEYPDSKWYTHPNFHVAYRSSNLVWLHDVSDKHKYIDFWTNNIHEIYQRKKIDVPAFFTWLQADGLIKITPENEKLLQEKFYNTNIPTLNICPGFGAIYNILDKQAEELDRKNTIRKFLLEQINEGLKIVGKDGSQFLRP